MTRAPAPSLPVSPAIGPRLARFARSESGSGTVEFAVMLPFFFWLFLVTFELGMLLTRQVMLDRGVDLAIREVRIGNVPEVTHAILKDMICAADPMLPNCATQLKLEMRPVDPRDWNMVASTADCVNRANTSLAARDFRPGEPNQLVVIRACALFDPYLPSLGLGLVLERQSGSAYALTSSSAYVIEPN